MCGGVVVVSFDIVSDMCVGDSIYDGDNIYVLMSRCFDIKDSVVVFSISKCGIGDGKTISTQNVSFTMNINKHKRMSKIVENYKKNENKKK